LAGRQSGQDLEEWIDKLKHHNLKVVIDVIINDRGRLSYLHIR
jgi:glycosidase